MNRSHGTTGIASDDMVEYWGARHDCIACGSIVSPVRTVDDTHHYECNAGHEHYTWTREV